MKQRGIRGAITIESNAIKDVEIAVKDLISEIKKQNNYNDSDISHVIFTLTKDINCIYPLADTGVAISL